MSTFGVCHTSPGVKRMLNANDTPFFLAMYTEIYDLWLVEICCVSLQLQALAWTDFDVFFFIVSVFCVANGVNTQLGIRCNQNDLSDVEMPLIWKWLVNVIICTYKSITKVSFSLWWFWRWKEKRATDLLVNCFTMVLKSSKCLMLSGTFQKIHQIVLFNQHQFNSSIHREYTQPYHTHGTHAHTSVIIRSFYVILILFLPFNSLYFVKSLTKNLLLPFYIRCQIIHISVCARITHYIPNLWTNDSYTIHSYASNKDATHTI